MRADSGSEGSAYSLVGDRPATSASLQKPVSRRFLHRSPSRAPSESTTARRRSPRRIRIFSATSAGSWEETIRPARAAKGSAGVALSSASPGASDEAGRSLRRRVPRSLPPSVSSSMWTWSSRRAARASAMDTSEGKVLGSRSTTSVTLWVTGAGVALIRCPTRADVGRGRRGRHWVEVGGGGLVERIQGHHERRAVGVGHAGHDLGELLLATVHQLLDEVPPAGQGEHACRRSAARRDRRVRPRPAGRRCGWRWTR